MPDTHYAKSQWTQELPPDGYAMISRSVGHRAELLFVNRMAGRGTPMMGIDRSILSCRTFLFLFVLLGTPAAARGDTLEDSAKELARKIAAALPTRSNASIGMQNSSSLVRDEVARITQALQTEVKNLGIGTPGNGFVDVMVAVTLSESFKSYVWTAEIHLFDKDEVVLTTIPRPIGNRADSDAMPMTLRGEKFWEGPENILDAAQVKSSNNTGVIYLLEPDGLIIRENDSESTFKVEIPLAQVPTRIPTGSFVQIGNACQLLEFASCMTLTLDSRICTIALDKLALVECHVQGPLWGRVPVDLTLTFSAPLPPGRSRPIRTIQSHCGDGTQFLSTRTGDYTQPDSVQALDGGAAAVSNELEFPGPVLALNGLVDAPTTATGVVRNLKTGNYEAYRLSISCGL